MACTVVCSTRTRVISDSGGDSRALLEILTERVAGVHVCKTPRRKEGGHATHHRHRAAKKTVRRAWRGGGGRLRDHHPAWPGGGPSCAWNAPGLAGEYAAGAEAPGPGGRGVCPCGRLGELSRSDA